MNGEEKSWRAVIIFVFGSLVGCVVELVIRFLSK